MDNTLLMQFSNDLMRRISTTIQRIVILNVQNQVSLIGPT